MRSLLIVVVALPALALPAFARAEGTSTTSRALWSAVGFADPADARLVESAVARSTNTATLDGEDVSEALARASAPVKPARDRDPDELLRRAHAAFVELRLGDAKLAYDRALAAILEDERGVADAKKTATIFFGRALVTLASQKKKQAERDLIAAITLDPTLAPDPDVYGPPVLRAVASAKRASSSLRAIELKIDRAPVDAQVWIDGREVKPGQTISVRGPGPHLLTAAKAGYRPRSKLLELAARGPAAEAIVLERASGALLAAQTLEAWRLEPGALSGERGAMIARCLKIEHVIEASRSTGEDVDLVLRNAESGEVVRAVRGRRTTWEPHAYAALAESFAGRTLTPPPEPVELTLALSAPNQVEPGATIPLLVDVRDPGRRLRRLIARCGERTSSEPVAISGHAARVMLSLEAPPEETVVPCSVRGLGDGGAVIVEAPQSGEIAVAVAEVAGPWYRRWYVWGVIGTAVAGGAALAIALRTERPEPEQVLVLHGPN